MNELDAVLRAICDVQAAGRRAALASVVSVAGSSYRRPGARMLVIEGAVSGAVSPGKGRHGGEETAVPTPGFPLKADKLTVLGWLSV
jgi:hypothetical protein